jgi:hypothetical protein
MTLQQTVTIPADRRLYVDWTLPRDTPTGEAEMKLVLTLKRAPKPRSAVSSKRTQHAAELARAEAEVAAAEAEAAVYTDAGQRIPIPLRGKVSNARLRRNALRLNLKPGEKSLLAWRGVDKGLVSEEEKLEWKREDRLLEEERERRWHSK